MEKRFPLLKRLPRALLKSVQENRVHKLISFLQRPVRVASGTWSTTQAANTELFSLDIPKVGFEQANFADKVQGFLGFRAKAVVRLQINSQRFQQGRLLMHYIPQGQAPGAQFRKDVIMQSLTLKTQTPRVEIDCATTTSAVLEMPYVSTTTHFNTHTYTGPIGLFECCVYSPLVSSAASTVAYTAWLHFEDVELSYPTTTFTAQCGVVYHTQASLANGLQNTISQGTRAIAQSIGIPGTISQIEAKINGGGPVGNTMAMGAVIADAASAIPMLSWFAKPASWVMSIIGGMADAFGWSNPKSNAPQVRVAVDTFAQAQNVDGHDNSHSIGLFNSNTVEILPGFAGTDTDEMEIAHVAKVPAYINNFTWNVTDAEDAQITSLQHCIQNYGFNRLVSNGTSNFTVTDLCPFTYIAQPFRFWRGSVNLTFKFIKTEFHSGRLIFYWFPNPSANGSQPSDSDLQFVYKEILDIRISNEFTVTVPFVNTKPYAKLSDVLGQWGLIVMNPLVAPDTVAQNIQILLEASAGPDFEVAVPTQPTVVPIYQIPSLTPQCGVTYKTQGLGENEAETTHPAVRQDAVDPIASSDIDSGGLTPAKYCIGERLCSLRQLLKRASAWFEMDWSDVYPSEGFWRNYLAPSDITLPYFVTGSVPVLYSNVQSTSGSGIFSYVDYINYFGSMYMYRRGGIRLKMYESGSGSSPANATYRAALTTRFNTYTLATAQTGSNLGGVSNFFVQPSLNISTVTGGLQIEVPQYSGIQSTININPVWTGVAIDPNYMDTNAVAFNIDSSTAERTMITRQLADDGNFGFFIGVLPVMTQTALANAGVTWAQTGF